MVIIPISIFILETDTPLMKIFVKLEYVINILCAPYTHMHKHTHTHTHTHTWWWRHKNVLSYNINYSYTVIHKWLNSITDLMDMNLSTLWEMVDRGAWHAAVHEAAKHWAWLSNSTTIAIQFQGNKEVADVAFSFYSFIIKPANVQREKDYPNSIKLWRERIIHCWFPVYKIQT